MANKIYNEVNANNPQNQYMSFMQNPYQFLINRRIEIPDEYRNNPHDAVQYLLNNGKMDQSAFNKVFSTLQRMGFKF